MDRALIVVRRRRGGWGISGRSIAVLAFLAMCAAFFCVPLYVMLVTSFKTMDQVRVGDIFALPVSWSLEAWKEAWFEACAGVKCEGLQAGFVNSLKILFPQPRAFHRILFRDRLRPGPVERTLGKWFPVRLVHLRVCAFPDHHDSDDPAVGDDRCLRQHARHRDCPRSARFANPYLDLPKFLQGHSRRDHPGGADGFRQLLAGFRRDHPADVEQHHCRRADSPRSPRSGTISLSA